jgi:predicted nicotinamide N-methyase
MLEIKSEIICVELRSSAVPVLLNVVTDIDELLDSLPADSEIPYWAVLWESSIGLSEWMLEHPQWVEGKHVLELGAGLGLCGMVATQLGAQVMQTDYNVDALRLAASNAQLNGLSSLPQFQADWRDWQHTERYEVILASDLFYDRQLHASLLKVLQSALLPGGVLLLADPCRDSGWEFEELLLQSGWHVDLHSKCVEWESRAKEIILAKAHACD